MDNGKTFEKALPPNFSGTIKVDLPPDTAYVAISRDGRRVAGFHGGSNGSSRKWPTQIPVENCGQCVIQPSDEGKPSIRLN